ncbi:MAG: PRC-barrel domain-containing protein [Proteobacteria bacterium]|nr:PRC-barrel domain-containing protein [Pseudomonadota bacterium]
MRFVLSLAAVAAAALLTSGPAYAQGATQTVQLAKIDVTQVAKGYRTSKIVGEPVINDAHETVGKVDDMIVSTDGTASFVILSVGGFLGVGSKLVALPYTALKVEGNKLTMPGATKEALKALPEFKYASR